MVPSTFHYQESLPLTANGKIDRKNLTALAGELDAVEEAGAILRPNDCLPNDSSVRCWPASWASNRCRWIATYSMISALTRW